MWVVTFVKAAKSLTLRGLKVRLRTPPSLPVPGCASRQPLETVHAARIGADSMSRARADGKCAGDGSGYIGFALGAVDYEEADEDLGETLSDTSTAYRVLGGYRFSDNFAVEGGWVRTSDLEENIVETLPLFGTLTLDVYAEPKF